MLPISATVSRGFLERKLPAPTSPDRPNLSALADEADGVAARVGHEREPGATAGVGRLLLDGRARRDQFPDGRVHVGDAPVDGAVGEVAGVRVQPDLLL